MESEVKIRLGIPRKMYDQMKRYPEIDWNAAAVREISKQFTAAGIRVEERGRQNPKPNHRKL